MVDQHPSGTVNPSAANWILATIIVAAMVPGLVALRGLEWPSDPDGFRDLAIAQAIQDGRGLADLTMRASARRGQPAGAGRCRTDIDDDGCGDSRHVRAARPLG